MLDIWRENFKGVQYHHTDTNLIITGAIDDIWLSNDGRHIVVDYKSTAKNGEVSLNADWQISYKRQMEIYQWLLRQNGLDVDPTGWFVYCNGKLDVQDALILLNIVRRDDVGELGAGFLLGAVLVGIMKGKKKGK